ncbi:MAG: hypothetical protein E5X51_32335 [Mesorhizobium sp.]|uniref:hypothetical protein n=1 Tax=Mesorhizobium sp. TaxID=1871066 RepID=UPI0011FFAF34|nr:hypothetical protein [Mesorhizobium sp.]TIQ17049.1 MAG: hypothetical protein E5X51_32335 [Mesorhizobium sp.]
MRGFRELSSMNAANLRSFAIRARKPATLGTVHVYDDQVGRTLKIVSRLPVAKTCLAAFPAGRNSARGHVAPGNPFSTWIVVNILGEIKER